MDDGKVHIDKLLRQQMADRAEAPPPELWDRLEQRLDAEDKRRKRPFPIWWFWAIGGLLFVTATTAIVANYNKDVTIQAQANKPMLLEKATIPNTSKTSNVITTAPDNTHTDYKNNNEETVSTPSSATTVSSNNAQQPNAIAASNLPTNSDSPKPLSGTSKQQPATNTEQRNEQTVAGNTPQRQQLQPTPRTAQTKHEPIKVSGQQPVTVQATTPVVAEVVATTTNSLQHEVEHTDKKESTTKNRTPQNKQPLIASTNKYSVLNIIANYGLQNTYLDILDNSSTPDVDTNEQEVQQSIVEVSDIQDLNNEPAEQETTTKEKKPLPIDFGVKVGYSMGFTDAWRANKYAIGPYMEYRLPSKLSLIFQPTFHMGNARTGAFENGSQSYYELKDNSFNVEEKLVRGVVDSTVVTPNPPDTIFRTYVYGQAYDSIHVGYNVTQKQMWDIELPLMLKYQINDKFAAFVGGSAMYSSVLQTKETVERFSMSNEYREEIDPQTFYVTRQGQEPPAGPAPKPFDDIFSNTGTPFSTFSSREIMQSKNFFRFGFMIGGSVTLKERWIVELMLQKTTVNKTAVPAKELQKIYSQPYLRFMVGYKLFK